MTHQAAVSTALRHTGDTRDVTASDGTLRLVGALLALAIATVHIADQGGAQANA